MSYNKTTWVDQNVENPRTYTMRDNGDNTVTLLDAFGTVTELGTPVNAANMNNIENGIAANDAAIATKQDTITGAATTITSSNLTKNRALISNSSGKIAVSSVTNTELGYLSGTTSALQTQIDGKQATITGAATSIISSNLTASRALVSNSNGKVTVSSTTSTELGYVHGVTSAIQTQINSTVKTTGNQTIAGTKTFSSTISGSINGNAATVTNGVYTSGNQTIGGTKTFSSSPVLPTPSNSDNSTKGATTAYVRNLIIPKYSSASNKSAGTEYTAGADCRIIISGTVENSGDHGSMDARVQIDGVDTFYIKGGYVYGYNKDPFFITFDLKKNQKYKIYNVTGTLTIEKYLYVPF